MSKRSYQLVDMNTAYKEGYPQSWEDDEEYEGTSGIWECEDGKPVKLLGTDGGEPEDASFCRDYSWVHDALERLADELNEARS